MTSGSVWINSWSHVCSDWLIVSDFSVIKLSESLLISILVSLNSFSCCIFVSVSPSDNDIIVGAVVKFSCSFMNSSSIPALLRKFLGFAKTG